MKIEAFKAELATARSEAEANKAAAARLAELTAAQVRAERDQVFEQAGIKGKQHLARLIEQEYDALQVEAGKERPSFADWIASQRSDPESMVGQLIGAPPASIAQPAQNQTPAQRSPAATVPATPANPGAADPKAAAKASFDAAMKAAEGLPVAERSAARQKALADFRNVAT